MDRPPADLVVRREGREAGADGTPTMLFLHGLTDSGEGWPEAVEHWQGDYAIVTVDQRGHGGSPRFTADQLVGHPGDVMVDDAVALLEQLDRPVLVGHSLGGAVGLAAAVRRADLVLALVLEDPAPLGPDDPQRSARRGQEFRAGIEDSRRAATDEELLEIRRAAHPDWPESELIVTGRAEQQMDADYLEHGDWMPSTRWPELFADVRVPTLVVSGDRPDEIVVDAAMEDGINRIGNPLVTVVRIPASGHCIRREQPAAYYALVDEWLGRLDP
jgi:pimeloyl-ACP methyl ester carboxylesterase